MKQTDRNIVLIVAGGSGKRMQNEIPKQFIEIASKPIIVYSIEQFLKYDPDLEIRVILPVSAEKFWQQIQLKYFKDSVFRIFPGGENRFDSVKNGLADIPENVLVAVHDAVRPFVSINTVEKCFKTAREKGSAIPVVPVKDSIRKIKSDESIPVNRDNLVAIQTPQVFLSEILIKSYNTNYDPRFTDDATVAEQAGYPINLVEGNIENIKITTPSDLLIAESFINAGY